MSFSLSIIIPAYNESARLGETLRTVFKYLNEHIADSELVVVDDGSSDATAEIAEESFAQAGNISAQLIRVQPNRLTHNLRI